MNNRKTIYSILMLALILGCIIGVIVLALRREGLSVVFLDVGQGDSILISQGSTQILIDGGRDGKLLLEKLGKHIPFWDRKIETVVMTHPDADHIAGLVDVLKMYEVDVIMRTDARSDSQTYKALIDGIGSEGAQIIEASAGERIKLPNNGEVDVLYPMTKDIAVDEKNTNDSSIVTKLIYGKNEFIFTGDLSSEKEGSLVTSSVVSLSDGLAKDLLVLKVSHHGSKYASSDMFLELLKPNDAIISVGAHNQYGHPNQETLDRLLKHRVNIIRTDISGDITYDCKNQESVCTMTTQK